jgi:rhodanese-related sulfurtransferase
MKNGKIIGAAAAVILGVTVAVLGQPSLDERVEKQSVDLSRILEAREIQVDPAELLEAIYNNNMAVKVLDARDETDFNLFHIKDSELVSLDRARDPLWVKDLPKQTVIMIVSNDETRAAEFWKLLKVQKVENIYILEGGINNWLARYSVEKPKPDADQKPGGLDYAFDLALGGNHPASDPDPEKFPAPNLVKKVRSIGKTGKKAGGCG